MCGVRMDDKAKYIISQALDIDLNNIPDDISMDKFSKWDSLGHLRIILEIEKLLGNSLETSDVLKIIDLKTINSLIENNQISEFVK